MQKRTVYMQKRTEYTQKRTVYTQERTEYTQTGTDKNGEVGGWGRDPKICTGRDWGMGSSTI